MSFSLPMGGQHGWFTPPATATTASTTSQPSLLKRMSDTISSGFKHGQRLASSGLTGAANMIALPYVAAAKDEKSPYASLMPDSTSTPTSAATTSTDATSVPGTSSAASTASTLGSGALVPTVGQPPTATSVGSGGITNPGSVGLTDPPINNCRAARSSNGAAVLDLDLPKAIAGLEEGTCASLVDNFDGSRTHTLIVGKHNNAAFIISQSYTPGKEPPPPPPTLPTTNAATTQATSTPGTALSATATDNGQSTTSLLDLATAGPPLWGNPSPASDTKVTLDYDNSVAKDLRFSEWCLNVSRGLNGVDTPRAELDNLTAWWQNQYVNPETNRSLLSRQTARECAYMYAKSTDGVTDPRTREVIHAGIHDTLMKGVLAGQGGYARVNRIPEPDLLPGSKTAQSKSFDGTDYSAWLGSKLGPPDNAFGYSQERTNTLLTVIDDVDRLGTLMCERHDLSPDEVSYFTVPVGTAMQEMMFSTNKREVTDDLLQRGDAILHRAVRTYRALPPEVRSTLISKTNGSATSATSTMGTNTTGAGTGTATTSIPTTLFGQGQQSIPLGTGYVPAQSTAFGLKPAQRSSVMTNNGAQYVGHPRTHASRIRIIG